MAARSHDGEVSQRKTFTSDQPERKKNLRSQTVGPSRYVRMVATVMGVSDVR
jgi:hypothetical protein